MITPGLYTRSCARLAIGVAAVALITASSSCKRSDQDKPADDRGEKDTAARVEKVTGPQPGGYLKLPSAEPRYLNPVIQTQLERANMLIFEGLVGLGSSLEPVKRLAVDWVVSPDGKTITFKLRTGVKWHDGQPFTSRDVKFTFDAIRETQVQSIWKAYMTSVAEVQTPDDHTVVVVYQEPYGAALTSWTMGIIPEHVYRYEKGSDVKDSPGNREPVGTGPYKLSRWEFGKRLVLQANRDWWYGEDSGMPYIDTIELLFGIGQEERVDLLAKGKFDFTDVEDIGEWVNKVQTPEFRERFEVDDVPEAYFRAIAWNTRKPHLSDKRVRLALTHALNRGRVIDDVLLGYARPLSVPFFPTMFGADLSIPAWPFDLTRAVKLLEEAGLTPQGKGPRFSIDMIALSSQDHPVTQDSLAIFRNDLGAIGVELETSYLSAPDFFDRVLEGNYDAVYFGWLPDIPDPDPYGILHSTMIGAGSNFARYSSAEVDKLLEQARATGDRDQRKAKYHELHRILHQEMPYTVLYAPLGHYAWNRRVRGVHPSDIGAQPRFPGLAGWWVVPSDEAASQAARGVGP